MALHGVDLYVAGGNRIRLAEAIASLEPPIPHLFFGNEEFDRYLAVLGVEDVVTAHQVDPKGGLSWLLDFEITKPVPMDGIARTLSKSGLLVARPRDEKAQYSSYLVYEGGELHYEAELLDEDTAPRLRPTSRFVG